MNDIMDIIKTPVKISIYADDLLIYCRGHKGQTVIKLLQDAINNLENWGKTTGFTFSTSKTKMMSFTKKTPRIHHLELYGNPIENVTNHCFLGMIFDSKLTWKAHIERLKTDCLKRLNIMKALANSQWGADEQTLLTIYRTLIRSKLDYGCIIYASASRTTLEKLNSIQNTALRLATGALRASPSLSLHRETGELPLHLRRQSLQLTYAARITADTTNPVRISLCQKRYSETYNRYPKLKTPLYYRIHQQITQNQILQVMTHKTTSEAPWNIPSLICDDSLAKQTKSDMSPQIVQKMFLEKLNSIIHDCTFYTDASKTEDSVGCAFTTLEHTKKFKLPITSSIFTGELYAIHQAMKHIEENAYINNVICTDSLSSLQSIKSRTISNPLVRKILDTNTTISQQGKKAVILWIPSHMGIPGNEKADREANDARYSGTCVNDITNYDLKSFCRRTVIGEWNVKWNQTPSKLRLIDPTIQNHTSNCITNRRDLIILRRLRIGHTLTTHAYMFNREDAPVCSHCGVHLTVLHILVQFPGLNTERKAHNVPQKIEEALNINNPQVANTLNFIKDTNIRV
ncbi:uncharacterized protein LOC123306596 [Coccinella septempunctata]|uniref:uncharacterized protein LOC123306596 n=1 Tax=Coccinella septempunctata TaxID=41139 RepID=UPI001D096B83|nr:uncharacterized protein LOC123306596 [Coccinella septempunctata]